jgi:Lar family restriction alleviation protein
MAELKPCPFCGGEAKIVDNGEASTNKYYFVDVLCKDMSCRGYSSCLEYKTKQQAIEAWNRRAEDA